MAQIQVLKGGKSLTGRRIRNLNVDLTPMVDLGFLLITFFILTAAMTKPSVTKLNMPMDKGITTDVPESMILNILLKEDHKIEYFEGKAAINTNKHNTNYSGIRRVIMSKQQKVATLTGDRTRTILIVTPSKQSTYEDFMRIIDEIQINDIRIYFVQSPV